MKTMRRRGWVQAAPTEYLLHYRRGKVIRQGLGLGAWALPVMDHCTLVPCTATSLTFAADQITQENQGVEIAGFAVWKISKPELTAQRFNFDDPVEPTKAISVCLKDVVESAIRHRVANMTIEEVLRKRATIILELKRELAYITDQWGLDIDTIEIKGVRIMSAQVFTHLQATYRETLRLQSETTTLQTEQEIAARRLAQRDAMNRQEADFRQREQERASQVKRQQQQLDHQTTMEAARLETERKIEAAKRELERKREEYALGIQAAEAELPTIAAKGRVEDAQREIAIAARRGELEQTRLAAEGQMVQTHAGNQRRSDLTLIESLPSIAEACKIGELNITPELIGCLGGLARKLCNQQEVNSEP